jgi:DNA-binding NtrC family response regulator
MIHAKVLLVDDEEDFTSVLAERMRGRGLEVDVCSNGTDAIEQAQRKFYDAVICDLAMPGLDGIQTLKLMLAQNPDLQVILLTGHATLEKGVEAMKSGAVEFLEKPANIDLLLEKIDQASVTHTRLTEKRMADSLDNILRSKGW